MQALNTIKRFSGDTYPEVVYLKEYDENNDLIPTDLSSSTLVVTMSVMAEDGTGYSIVATKEDAANGKVSFDFESGDGATIAANPGNYTYTIKTSDNGIIKTYIRNKLIVE